MSGATGLPISESSANDDHIAGDHTRKGRPLETLKAYQDAWSQVAGVLDGTHQVWLVLSIVNSSCP